MRTIEYKGSVTSGCGGLQSAAKNITSHQHQHVAVITITITHYCVVYGSLGIDTKQTIERPGGNRSKPAETNRIPIIIIIISKAQGFAYSAIAEEA